VEFQEAIIVGLAIAALALSILSIVFGIIFFRMQMQQARSMMKETSDFTQQMTTLLNEVRISQNLTGQQIKDQYDKLLDAAIHGHGSSVDAAATSAVQVEELGKRLESLEKEVKGLKEPQKVEAQTRALREALERLKTTVGQLATHVTEEERERPKPRFEQFTERARRALVAAQEEAQRLNHNYIGPEHLLLGLIRDGKDIACKVLTNLGLDLSELRKVIEFLLVSGKKPLAAEIGLSDQGKRVIELSIDEARRLGHNYIGTEHLLLAILLEGGVVAGVLQNLNVTLEKARAETVKVLAG
jgi:uncharacterized protein (DUF697 family)